MKVKGWLIILTLIIGFTCASQAQIKPVKKVVQFTGIITDIESEFAVPYVSIFNISYQNQSFRANHQGFFSFVAHEGDTIQLSSVGYRSVQMIIPKVEDDRFTTLIELSPDVVSLPAVHVLPWASVEEFNIAFMNLKVASDDLLLAKQNLTRESLQEMAKHYPMSPDAMQTFTSNQAHINLSNKTTNEKGSNPLLNPFAWGKFINQIQQGKESRKKY